MSLTHCVNEQKHHLDEKEVTITLPIVKRVKKLEAQLGHLFSKQQLSSQKEKLTFQANEIYEKEKSRDLRLENPFGPQEPEPSVSDDRSSEYSTCQSNDSAGSIGTSSEHSVDPESEISRVPLEVSRPPVPTRTSNSFSPKRPQIDLLFKTSAKLYLEDSKPNYQCDSGQLLIRTVNAKGSSTEEHGR
ncbi:hypothetical protein Tco_0706569 [Tanacetum coccineum]|uniref:Uncharacterized protein n=1 Tax=Tanacetum coccineum TaxID=301880 RepID=A0ABQ4Y9V9_9ASTR